MKYLLPLCYLFCFSTALHAQDGLFEHKESFTRQDSLRGAITPERAWWDLKHYDLNVEVNPKTKSINGFNTITFEVLDLYPIMQIDLQEPLIITKIVSHGGIQNQELNYKREGNVFWIEMPNYLTVGSENKITIYYEGLPKESKNPPWSGGVSWKKDENGTDFIATANQGIGASIWWPNKDHYYDEPDNGMLISVTVPEHLVDVSNGKLIECIHNKDAKTKTYKWEVLNPINNYGVNLNIGDYVQFSRVYKGEKGLLDFDFWVLKHNLKKAKAHFIQAEMTIEAFEHWFGPYPFYEDSYKLVETNYSGMEHQSSVTYGNNYENGYRGRDVSGTGVGFKFDFIIVHETGHEWFANNITNKDVADMWIHESFTAYSENLYVNYHFSKKDAEDYVIGTRKNILNDKPIIGIYDVNHAGSGDMYYKGSNMLHTLRQMINDDESWRLILRGLNKDFYHQQVTTKQIEDYIIKHTGLKLKGFFNQYLRTVQIPVFNYRIKNKNVHFYFDNTVSDFSIPIKVYINEEPVFLEASNKSLKYKHSEDITSFRVDRNYYVNTKQLN